MKKMRTIIGAMVLAMVVSIGCYPGVQPTAAEAFKLTSLTPKAISTKNVKVKVKWNKSSKAKLYRIYRSKALKKEPDSGLTNKQLKYKKIKTTGSGTTKYTDNNVKYGRWYVYKVVALKKKGSSYKKVEESELSVYTGPDTMMWDDYLYADGYVSSSRIDLWIYYGDQGMKAQGFQIYRKEVGGKYKKIKTIKRKKNKSYVTYKDKTVTTGTTYKYKIRSYRKVGTKKKYGPWSEVMTKRAVKKNGVFEATYLDAALGSTVDEMVVQLTSTEKMGNLKFTEEFLYQEDIDATTYFKVYYSTDGQKTWTATSDKTLVLKTGKSVILKLVPVVWVSDGTTGSAQATTYTVPTEGFTLQTNNPVYYNNVVSNCTLQIGSDGTGTLGTSIAEEYVH
ncbi:hypothetical protein [Eubacterium oxidoreducens]|nr:hypothetical protein [Eubacterium oxidoreducens]